MTRDYYYHSTCIRCTICFKMLKKDEIDSIFKNQGYLLCFNHFGDNYKKNYKKNEWNIEFIYESFFLKEMKKEIYLDDRKHLKKYLPIYTFFFQYNFYSKENYLDIIDNPKTCVRFQYTDETSGKMLVDFLNSGNQIKTLKLTFESMIPLDEIFNCIISCKSLINLDIYLGNNDLFYLIHSKKEMKIRTEPMQKGFFDIKFRFK